MTASVDFPAVCSVQFSEKYGNFKSVLISEEDNDNTAAISVADDVIKGFTATKLMLAGTDDLDRPVVSLQQLWCRDLLQPSSTMTAFISIRWEM